MAKNTASNASRKSQNRASATVLGDGSTNLLLGALRDRDMNHGHSNEKPLPAGKKVQSVGKASEAQGKPVRGSQRSSKSPIDAHQR